MGAMCNQKDRMDSYQQKDNFSKETRKHLIRYNLYLDPNHQN